MPDGNDSNRICLSGKVKQTPVYSHTAYGEDFFTFPLTVVRRSGVADEINVMVSERLFGAGISDMSRLTEAERIGVTGQIRTYNERDGQTTHLRILVFARAIETCGADGFDGNSLTLDGFLCRDPVYRRSPLGREICDLLLAVNRSYGKSDYIPCIVWGRNAVCASSLVTGDHIRLSGRFQSRRYRKKLGADSYEMRTAYEVSANLLELPE